jgi:hypothetical protein
MHRRCDFLCQRFRQQGGTPARGKASRRAMSQQNKRAQLRKISIRLPGLQNSPAAHDILNRAEVCDALTAASQDTIFASTMGSLKISPTLKACTRASRLAYKTCNPTRTCAYHSEHHPDPPPFPQAQETILAAAMRHVPTHGFSSKTLVEGAKDSGYLEVSVQLFPRGVFDLINYHLVTQRLALNDRVQFPEDSKIGVGRKVRTLALERLGANKEVIHQWQGVCLICSKRSSTSS